MVKLYYPTQYQHPITQLFGQNLLNYGQFGLKGHNGIDWGCRTGTALYAVADGVVVTASDDPGFGRVVEINHARCKSVYAHLARMDVRVGDTVTAKQMIGISDGELTNSNPGFSTGAHLHFGVKPLKSEPEYNHNNGYLGAIDPLPLMTEWSATLTDPVILWTGKTTAGLNVRSSPTSGVTTNKIGLLPLGAKVEVIGTSGDWLQINWVQTAYVHGAYVKRDVEVPPVTNPAYTPGMDVSFWQGTGNDFQQAYDEGLRFVIIRAGQNRKIDDAFVTNHAKAEGVMPRAAYWFYDWRSSGGTPEQQAQAFKAVLDLHPCELPPVIDFEDPYEDWTTEAFPSSAEFYSILQRFKQAMGGMRMVLYTNQATLAKVRPYPDWLTSEWLLWIAQWPLVNGRQCSDWTQIPAGYTVTTYGWTPTYWQYSAKTDGQRFGVGSLDLDGDVFIGDENKLRELCNPNASPELTDAEKLRRLWEAHPELHK
jgi:GH25 family lysozyme M1 (1,4-beta-N-acetylmuramidase)